MLFDLLSDLSDFLSDTDSDFVVSSFLDTSVDSVDSVFSESCLSTFLSEVLSSEVILSEDFSVDSDTTGVLSSLDTVSVFLGPHAVNDIATIRAVARSHAGFFIVIILSFLILCSHVIILPILIGRFALSVGA